MRYLLSAIRHALHMQFWVRLQVLAVEQRDLDDATCRISGDPVQEQFSLRRMKRRKLRLKDQKLWICNQLDPDVHAWISLGQTVSAPGPQFRCPTNRAQRVRPGKQPSPVSHPRATSASGFQACAG